MLMKNHLILFLLSCFSLTGYAQIAVEGTVTDKAGEPLAFVTVAEEETTNGTTTDLDGRYKLTVDEGAILRFTYVGMQDQLVPLEGRKQIDVVMDEDAYQLDGVVVTAFGIEKEKKAAGFAFSEVNGSELTEAREVNVAAQLVGKVPGLDITKPSNGPSGSTRIVIRGLSQFQGENRPLIVIDGIPADNSNINRAGLYGGRDSGDGLSAVNPDDIENITVLLGPSAAALYGSRAGNGVILITTKKGTVRKGLGVEYSSNFVTEEVTILPNFQEEYGQGANGQKPTSQQEAFDNWRSWGARLDGSMTPVFNGEMLPYSAVGQDDLRDFYQRGNTWTNTLAFNGGNEKMNARLSLSALSNEGIILNSRYDRYNLNFVSRAQLTDRVDVEAKVNYTQEDAENRVNLTDNPSNPSKYFTIAPANLPHSIFRRTRNELGNPIYWSNNPFTLSPYWGPVENVNNDTKRRVLGYALARWRILDWLTIQGRVATDETTHDFFNVEIDGTQHNIPGAIFIDDFNTVERNYDVLIRATRSINAKIGLDVTAGAVRTDRSERISSTSGSDFINPGFLSINNMAIRNPGQVSTLQSRNNGIFATASLSYDNYLYLEGSVRTDFFSVLTNPLDVDGSTTSITYASSALSFVLSDAVELPDWISYAKFRAGYGTSGFGQIDPYSQVQVYQVSPDPKEMPEGNVTFGNIDGDSFRNPSLKPSQTRSFEIGTDWRLFKSKVGLQLTYYQQRTDRHIFPSPLPASTGFSSYLINAGEVENKGIEALVSYQPIQTTHFSWEVSVNFARNVNKVISLNEGIDQLNLGDDRTFSANIVAQKGGRIGDIWGNVYARNDAGQIIHGDDGLPVIAEDREILGNFNPNWYGGLTSTFSYKNLSLSFLIDTKQGGEILSTTSSFGYLFGRHINSVEGRDSPDFTIIGDGVGPDGVTPNTTPARIDDYYERISSISEENVYDASYIKLRQLSLSYTFDRELLRKTKFIEGLTISVVGRNLFFFTNGLDEIGLDPEAIYTATADDIGIEYAALPSTRSYGFNINVKF